jgi:hypothetical protein
MWLREVTRSDRRLDGSVSCAVDRNFGAWRAREPTSFSKAAELVVGAIGNVMQYWQCERAGWSGAARSRCRRRLHFHVQPPH